MSSTLKRSVARGFTLIELLIVVIILAILAAIAIPQFSSSTSDAQLAALDANLSTVRSAVEQYKVQHNNNYPGAKAATGATNCPAGGAAITTGDANSKEALVAQLQNYSNSTGAVCTTGGGDYKYGPYLRQGLPVEPINNSTAVAMNSTNGAPIAAGTVGGWAYNTVSGQFIMNSTTADAGGTKKYSEH